MISVTVDEESRLLSLSLRAAAAAAAAPLHWQWSTASGTEQILPLAVTVRLEMFSLQVWASPAGEQADLSSVLPAKKPEEA